MPNLTPIGQGGSHVARTAPTKEHLATPSIFLSFLLVLTLIGLGERLLYDLNRLYNPHYEACNHAAFIFSVGGSCPTEQYAFQQVLLHSYVSFPLFVIFLILVLYLRRRRLSTWQKALFRVSSVVSIFFGIQFLAEAIIYLFKFHHLVGVYVSYTLGAILLTAMVIYIEHKQAKKRSASQSHK